METLVEIRNRLQKIYDCLRFGNVEKAREMLRELIDLIEDKLTAENLERW